MLGLDWNKWIKPNSGRQTNFRLKNKLGINIPQELEAEWIDLQYELQ